MINAVYHEEPLIFIKAVSDTVFDMINAVYHDKPLIFIGARFLEKVVSHHQTEYNSLNTFEFIKAVSDTVFDMINAVYHDKPLILIAAIRLSLSRLFLTLYLT